MDSNNTINIVKYIIRNTPFGHVKETIDNLKTLVGNNIIEHPEIQEEIKNYEEDHFKQISLNEEKIVISKFNKDQDNYYYDQSKNLKICVNPLNENIEKIEKIGNADGEAEGIHYTDAFSKNLHTALTRLFNEYRDRCYKNGVAAVNGK
jgi:capping protein alpha